MRGQSGHTLVEVMIVVIIIAVIAALAIPRYMYSTAVSKQKEAQGILKQIYELQRAYQMENDVYFIPAGGTALNAADPTAFQPLGIELMASAKYTYTIVAAGLGFQAQAVTSNLDDDATLDIWQIDDRGSLVAISDDAVN